MNRATIDDTEIAQALLSASAEVVTVSEEELHAVTAVSGSGPAYVFHFAECMLDAAQENWASTVKQASC